MVGAIGRVANLQVRDRIMLKRMAIREFADDQVNDQQGRYRARLRGYERPLRYEIVAVTAAGQNPADAASTLEFAASLAAKVAALVWPPYRAVLRPGHRAAGARLFPTRLSADN